MSLSKFSSGLRRIPSDNHRSEALPRWQVAVLIGAPVIIGLGGLWWYRSRSTVEAEKESPDKAPGEKPTVTVKGTPASNQKEDLKPVYQRLKDEGNAMFRAEKYQEALKCYSRAIEEETPSDKKQLAMLYQNRAAVFEKLKDYNSIIKECTTAIELDPRYVKALTRRAKAYKATGFLDDALEDITAVCILENFSQSSSVQLADDVLKELGEREAAKIIRERKLVAPSHHAVNSFLRSFYNDPITKLWAEGNAGVNGDFNESELKGYAAAIQKLRVKDYDSVINLCTEEIKTVDSEHKDDALHLRGTFLFLWGDKEGTLADLTAVAESNTASKETRASAYIKLGSFHALQENESDAYLKCFEKAEELTPENVDVFHHRGQVLLTKGALDDAVQQLAKATEMCPDFALAAASHLYISYRQHVVNENNIGQAKVLRDFPKLVRKHPSSPDVYNLYGQLLMETQKFEEADQQFSKVLELEPKNASIFVHKAMSEFQRTQNVERAIKALRDSLKLDDRNEFVYETLGTLELQSGHLTEAVEAISKALEYAKSFQEMMMLSSLKKAAEVQVKIKDKIGLQTPAFPAMGNGMM